MEGHVSIEQLFAKLRERDPRISIPTVYRSIKLLVESELIVPRQFGERTLYEASGHHHDHLICTGCGSIVEFENRTIEQLQLRVARQHRFTVTSHKMELYGQCARCRSPKSRGSQ